MVIGIDALEQRQSEGGCFARTGLGKGYYIVGISQQAGNDTFLYWHRGFETHLFDGSAQRLIDPYFFK